MALLVADGELSSLMELLSFFLHKFSYNKIESNNMTDKCLTFLIIPIPS